MARDHALTEGHLRTCGLPFTALRDNLYLDVLPHLFDGAGIVRGPAGHGAAAYVSREDVAHVVAATLTADWDGQHTPDVTGPEALTFTHVVTRLAALTGRALFYVDEPVEEGCRWRAASGAPHWAVETWLGSYLATAAGELDAVSDTVTRVTGRRPMTLEQHFAAQPDLLAPLRP
jgi:NAD(P)H dehydrogenase (quinone)